MSEDEVQVLVRDVEALALRLLRMEKRAAEGSDLRLAVHDAGEDLLVLLDVLQRSAGRAEEV